MEDVERPRNKGGRPKKAEDPIPCAGFMRCHIEDVYFRMPTMWMEICAEIDNLAELKIVQYVIRHTVGYIDDKTGLPDYSLKKISIDEFVNGRKCLDGTRMDGGTGLSESAAKDGLARALKHEYIICEIDERDKARIKKYYGLKMLDVEYQQDLREVEEETQTGELFTPSDRVINSIGQSYQTNRSSNKPKEETNENKPISRKREQPVVEPENIRYIHPQRNSSGEEDVEWMVSIITDFSRDLGDHENTRSNVTRAIKIYKQSHVDPDAFLSIVYEAKAKAQKATIKKVNARGRPNRMPYFFKCLEQLLKPAEVMKG